MKEVLLKHNSGLVKKVKLGYSWKVCLLGPLLPFIDGYNKMGVILSFTSIIGVFTYGMVSQLASIIIVFFLVDNKRNNSEVV